MRLLRLLLSTALLLAPASGSASRAQNARSALDFSGRSEKPASDVAGLQQELQRIASLLAKNPSEQELHLLRNSLPSAWTVSTSKDQYSISTEPLRKLLTPSSREQALDWVNHLQEELSAYNQPAANSAPRSELDKILARAEFGAARPPTQWELLRQRIVRWLEDLLLKILSGIGRYPIGAKILFWALVVLAVAIVAALVFRFFASRDRVSALPANAPINPGRTWQEWIREARGAAKRGNYREAVHSAYWAGIARLEDLSVLPKDRTKTPREYLRLVTEPAPGQLAPPTTHREPLTDLTQRLERVWYADRGARPEDFTDSLRQLEALGCTLE
jgi:hypothetical protein